MCLWVLPTEERCRGQRRIQTLGQLGPESLYEAPKGQRDWLGWGGECWWWTWCWKAWEALGKGRLEQRIYGPCWLEGQSVTEENVRVTTEHAGLLHDSEGLTKTSVSQNDPMTRQFSHSNKVLTSCPSAACAPVLGPLLHWERLMASLAQLSTSLCRSSVKVPLPFWV